MNGYLNGMTKQMAAKYFPTIVPKAKLKVAAGDIPRFPIKVSVGCKLGVETFVTVKMSLNQLKEAGRRLVTGNGGYLETVHRVESFKNGTLL